MKTYTTLILVLILTTAFSIAAFGHAGDIGIVIEDNKLVTGLLAEENGEEVFHKGERVFGAHLDELISPHTWYSSHPGFEAEAGVFSPLAELILSQNGTTKKWTGSGYEACSESFIVSPTEIAADGTGYLHGHVSFLLTLDGVNEPADGIYLLELALSTDMVGVADADPVYLVLDKNMGPDHHPLAVQWVRANVVPEPATVAGMAMGLAGLAGYGLRRRK